MVYMNNINLKSLEIEKLIRAHILYKDYSKIDLIGVFFHEIMIYATNYYIIKTSKNEYTQEVKFPFLNSEYVQNLPKLNFEHTIERKRNIKYKIIKFIQLFSPISKSIDVEDNVDIDIKNFIIRNFFKYKFNDSLNTKIFIENKQEQIANLKLLLEKIAQVLDITAKENFILNFIEYVNCYISQKSILAQSDFLIVGSNARLSSRINSAIYLSQGKKVISFCHGEHSAFVLDEPVIGHVELSYCSDYITYGRKQDFEELRYALPIIKLPKIHYRSSGVIKTYHNNQKNISDINLTNNSKVLYIPTLFSSNQRYGPFRDIEDSLYQKLQESILSLDYDITYKAHPKSKIEVQLNHHKVVRENLKDVLLNYDFYILDYISTASALCVATDKPIIYFNLGMRNLQKEAKEIFKKRVYWVDIDMDKDFDTQINQAIEDFNLFNRKYVNEYTEKFSLAEYNKSEIEVLEEIIKESLNAN